MKVVNERSAIASYDLSMHAKAQLRGTDSQRRVDHGQAKSTGAVPRPSGKMAELSLQLNQQSSSMQSAHHYLTQVAEHLMGLKRDLDRSLGAQKPGAADIESLSRSVGTLNKLLDNRSRLSAASLDAKLRLSLDEPVRSRFSIKGLESVRHVLASGSETLLFNAGRHMPGPIAVVLDNDMNAAQLLRRLNAGLAQAGLHAQVDDDTRLSFSAAEPQWRKLKGQLSIQGEDKLFAKTSFTPIQSQEDTLLGDPLVAPKNDERSALREMFDTADEGLTRINGVIEDINWRQAQAVGQMGYPDNQEEQRWAHDFTERLFDSTSATAGNYARVVQVVQCQANVSRNTVVGLLGRD